MAAGRPIFALLSLILVAGAILLTFFILLAGAIDSKPVNKFYFLSVDTSSISGAAATSRWTFWNICSVTSAGLSNCGKVHPAFPFDPPAKSNFGTSDGVPDAFLHTKKFYYLTRFMFAFCLIYLFFAVCSFFAGILALCTRIGSYLSGLLAMTAAFFSALTAALMTAAYVIGMKAFNKNNETAHLGKYAFGFLWASYACLFIASILYCTAGARKSDNSAGSYSSKKSMFGGRRSRSTRSRGSFIDTNNKELA